MTKIKQFCARSLMAKELERQAREYHKKHASYSASYAASYAAASAASYSASYAAASYSASYAAAYSASYASASYALTKKFEVMDNVWNLLHVLMMGIK